MKVKLNYFKSTGKWYTSEEYETEENELFGVWAEVRKMFNNNELPGINGREKFFILIEVLNHPNNHPYLIVPSSQKEESNE